VERGMLKKVASRLCEVAEYLAEMAKLIQKHLKHYLTPIFVKYV
jgi:hypothetical protein